MAVSVPAENTLTALSLVATSQSDMIAAGLRLAPLCLKCPGTGLGPAVNCEFPAGANSPVFALTPGRVIGNSTMGDLPTNSECIVVSVSLDHNVLLSYY